MRFAQIPAIFFNIDRSGCVVNRKCIFDGFCATVDSLTSFTLSQGVRNLGKVGVGKCWKLGIGVGHFTSDSATLTAMFDRHVVS